jgi:hypothetical protein
MSQIFNDIIKLTGEYEVQAAIDTPTKQEIQKCWADAMAFAKRASKVDNFSMGWISDITYEVNFIPIDDPINHWSRMTFPHLAPKRSGSCGGTDDDYDRAMKGI